MNEDCNVPVRAAHHPASRMRRVTVWAGYLAAVGALVWMADHPQFKPLLALMRRLPFRDKGVHFVVMGGLGFAFNFLLRCRAWRAGEILVHPGTLLAGALVVAEEFSQGFIPGRVFDIGDIDAGLLGVFLFAKLARLAFRRGWLGIPMA